MENINLKNNMNSEFELDERAGDSIFNKVIRMKKQAKLVIQIVIWIIVLKNNF